MEVTPFLCGYLRRAHGKAAVQSCSNSKVQNPNCQSCLNCKKVKTTVLQRYAVVKTILID